MGAQVGHAEVGGHQGREYLVVAAVDQPHRDLLGPLAALGRTEVVDDQQRAAGEVHQLPLAVVAGAGPQLRVQVGGRDRLPPQPDAGQQQGPDRAVRLVRLAGAGGADDQQRAPLGDTRGSLRPGAACLGDLADPGGDRGVVGDGLLVAGRDAGLRRLQGRYGLGRVGELGVRVDAPSGEDVGQAAGDAADGLGVVVAHHSSSA